MRGQSASRCAQALLAPGSSDGAVHRVSSLLASSALLHLRPISSQKSEPPPIRQPPDGCPEPRRVCLNGKTTTFALSHFALFFSTPA